MSERLTASPLDCEALLGALQQLHFATGVLPSRPRANGTQDE